jgi:osmoprotectant transport system permease protein
MRYIFFSGLIIFSSFVQAQKIRVGAKHFNEGYILSEVISQLLESRGFEVERKFNLGGTMVCFSALQKGEIDVYPEYSGTLSAEILKLNEKVSLEKIRTSLQQKYKLTISEPYGFNNTYALVIKKSIAETLRLTSIADLKKYPGLRPGLSYEFLKREDGWENLSLVYSLPQKAVGLEHGLAYEALQSDKIDLTDAYSTDGEIPKYNLALLRDDRGFFPAYEAVSLYSVAIPDDAKQILAALTNTITEAEMQSMNASVLYEKKTFSEVARDFLKRKNLTGETRGKETETWREIVAKTLEHIWLTFISILAAVLIAIPLGVFIYWNPRMANTALYITGLLQTIPSIALLAVMIPLFGIGPTPAIVALFLYALLPIIRNTVAGLQSIDLVLKKVADSLGMNRFQKLKLVEFPLAIPHILTGIRIAAVINIGTATLAAFIGAGGLGEFIVTGLALNNTTLILQGALPAAALALLVELMFELLESVFIPRHLK